VGSLALTTALVLVAGVAFRWLDRAQPALAGWAAVLALVAVLPQVTLTWLQDFSRLQFQPWRFALIGLVQATLAGAAGLVFVAGFDFGLPGFFAGALMGAVVTGAVAAVGARGAWPLAFSREELTRLVRFGAPFVPAGVFIWASSAVLRWQIAHYRGLEEAGLFEVAWKLSAPVWMLNAAIGQAFGPYAFRLRAEVPDYRARLVDIFHLVLAVYAGLNGFYLLHSQRLHPLPFRAGPILVHVAVGGLTIVLVAYLREQPISVPVLAVKLGWCALVALVLLRWGGSDVGRIRGMLRNFAAGFGTKRGAAH
jgi:O-antigen/teichoic acid export membrane protein